GWRRARMCPPPQKLGDSVGGRRLQLTDAAGERAKEPQGHGGLVLQDLDEWLPGQNETRGLRLGDDGGRPRRPVDESHFAEVGSRTQLHRSTSAPTPNLRAAVENDVERFARIALIDDRRPRIEPGHVAKASDLSN